MSSVYLAGPITGLTYDEGQDWRGMVRADLGEWGIRAFSPLRGKDYLRKFERLDAGGSGSSYKGINVLSDPAGIVARDRRDCTTCDLVVVNVLGAERVSAGTCIELGWADSARVPVILVMEKDGSNPHDHAMILALASYHVESLQEAIEVCGAVLLP